VELDRSVTAELTDLLREARAHRRVSQWDLSLELGVSQRHLSFVELGRSRPSRDLLVRWLDALEVPLLVRNEALMAAGHAPAYDESPIDAPAHDEARRAVAHLLRAHDPWPALLLDRRWDVVAANDGVRWLLDAVGSDVVTPGPDPGDESGEADVRPNLLDLALGDLGSKVVNLPEVVAHLHDQLRHEAVTEPSLAPRVEVLEQLVGRSAPAPVRFPPTLVTRYASRHGELSFLSMFTTFGTPHSVTLSSLRIELLFPADDATRAARSR
jgi:transcriptional regulator with XRE-family HTH domain